MSRDDFPRVDCFEQTEDLSWTWETQQENRQIQEILIGGKKAISLEGILNITNPKGEKKKQNTHVDSYIRKPDGVMIFIQKHAECILDSLMHFLRYLCLR